MRLVVMVMAAMAAVAGASPAMAGGGRQVDPREMERAAAVARPGPIDARVVGAWDVWIPGSVYYLSDGRRVTGHYQPGAAMNRLEIAADGGYRWGTRRGRLEEVLPWHAQPGRRYFRVTHASGDEYEFYHGDGDKLVVLFGGVGGHAATGTRLGGPRPATTTAPASRPAPTAGTRGPAAGAQVRILWSGSWYPGRVLRVDGDRYLVSYDGYGSSWDEWVDASRLRAPDGDARGNAPAPAPAGGTAGNPLGVEWRSGPQGAPPPAAGGGSNPLGVEWATAQAPARPSPPPAPAEPPAPPAPVEPPAPVAPPAPVTPPTPAVPTELARDLADRWRYLAAAFHGDGRVDEALGVDGTLHLKPNGEYEQSLAIGGIGNNVKGTWAVEGDRIVTRYVWRGREASDVLAVHLRGDGKLLTLVRQGTPVAYYTLQRME